MQNNIYSALAACAAVIENAVSNKKNEHFKNHYADLAAVREAVTKPLAEQGLFIMHEMAFVESKPYCKSMVVHTSGESIHTLIPLLFDKQDMQSIGKALTYAKRQGICMLLNLAHEKDDDGEELRKQHDEKKRMEEDLNSVLPRDRQEFYAQEISRLSAKDAYAAVFGDRKPSSWLKKDIKDLNVIIMNAKKIAGEV
jgi:hypothetical protein